MLRSRRKRNNSNSSKFHQGEIDHPVEWDPNGQDHNPASTIRSKISKSELSPAYLAEAKEREANSRAKAEKLEKRRRDLETQEKLFQINLEQARIASLNDSEEQQLAIMIFEVALNEYGSRSDPPIHLISVMPDGNCLYHAIKESLKKALELEEESPTIGVINSGFPIQLTAQNLRRIATKEMEEDKAQGYQNMFKILYNNGAEDIRKYTGVTYGEYVQDQAKNGTFADEIAIQALANLIQINIVVLSSMTGQHFGRSDFNCYQGNERIKEKKITITIANRAGVHFYAMAKYGEQQQEEELIEETSSEFQTSEKVEEIKDLEASPDIKNTKEIPILSIGRKNIKEADAARINFANNLGYEAPDCITEECLKIPDEEAEESFNHNLNSHITSSKTIPVNTDDHMDIVTEEDNQSTSFEPSSQNANEPMDIETEENDSSRDERRKREAEEEEEKTKRKTANRNRVYKPYGDGSQGSTINSSSPTSNASRSHNTRSSSSSPRENSESRSSESTNTETTTNNSQSNSSTEANIPEASTSTADMDIVQEEEKDSDSSIAREKEVEEELHVGILVGNNLKTFSYFIETFLRGNSNGRIRILGNGRVHTDVNSSGCIFQEAKIPDVTIRNVEVIAAMEAFGKIYQMKLNEVVLPKKITLCMNKKDTFNGMQKTGMPRGPTSKTRFILNNLVKELKFEKMEYLKLGEGGTENHKIRLTRKSNERQPPEGNNILCRGAEGGRIYIKNTSISLPILIETDDQPTQSQSTPASQTSSSSSSGKNKKENKSVDGNGRNKSTNSHNQASSRASASNNSSTRASSNATAGNITNPQPAQARENNAMDIEDPRINNHEETGEEPETPLEELEWNHFGDLLNVSMSSFQIPQSLINPIRKVYSTIIKAVEETIELKKPEMDTTAWLKRLEIIPIVLFTIKGSPKQRLEEMAKRIDWMNKNKWDLLTYELVYQKRPKRGVSRFKKERAENLVAQGLISKSFQYVKNAGKPQRQVEVNEDVLEKLESLHPVRPIPFQQNWIEESVEEEIIPDISAEKVEKVINDLKLQANPGLMQFRSEHIQELISEKGGKHMGKKFLKDYARFISMICKGNVLPRSYHTFLAACQSIPLPKGEVDIRPIAIPHLARKIAEKCIAEMYSKDFEKHFRGLQFGVATSNGMEKLIHEMEEARQANPENDIVLLDSANAFNNQFRDAAFQEVKTYFPEMLPFILSIYNKPTNLFVAMEDGKVETMLSTMGAHQGAPLGSMIYSAGQQPLLRGVAEILERKGNAKARAYIDDTSLQGHIDNIEEGLQYLQQESGKYGIKFKNEKIKIFIGECSPEEAEERVRRYQHIFNNMIPLGNFSMPGDAPITRGIKVMNVPLGTDAFVRRTLEKVFDELKEDCEVVKGVKSLQQRWTYIHFTLNGKINHLCRSISQRGLTMELSSKFEKLRKELIEEIVDEKLDDFQWFQAQLGISFGGFGMKSGQHTVMAAHLASGIEYLRYKVKSSKVEIPDPNRWLQTIIESDGTKNDYAKQILENAVQIFRAHGDPTRNTQVYDWVERGERKDNTQTSAAAAAAAAEPEETEMERIARIVFNDNKPLQHRIYSLLYTKTANAYVKVFFDNPNNSNANKARFRSVSGEHAGKWLAAIPREGFYMESKEFKVAMCLRLGINVTTKGYTCTCGRADADDSYHYLNCKLGNQITNRHKSIASVFAEMFKTAGQMVATEVHLEEEDLTRVQSRRSDLTIKRQNSLTGRSHHQHFDITVVNPSAKSYTEQVQSHLYNGVTARRAHNNKIKKYCDLVDKEDFHPLAMETFGTWTREVSDIIRKACYEIAEEKEIPYSTIVNYWYTKLSFVLQWENAITLIEREDFAKNKAWDNGGNNARKTNVNNFKRFNVRPK